LKKGEGKVKKYFIIFLLAFLVLFPVKGYPREALKNNNSNSEAQSNNANICDSSVFKNEKVDTSCSFGVGIGGDTKKEKETLKAEVKDIFFGKKEIFSYILYEVSEKMTVEPDSVSGFSRATLEFFKKECFPVFSRQKKAREYWEKWLQKNVSKRESADSVIISVRIIPKKEGGGYLVIDLIDLIKGVDKRSFTKNEGLLNDLKKSGGIYSGKVCVHPGQVEINGTGFGVGSSFFVKENAFSLISDRSNAK
jgi:hypothetical protein